MKKVIFLLILSVNLMSCGSKNMDETPDGSDTGPNYVNDSDNPNIRDTAKYERQY